MQYWLFKSEPESFSFEMLKKKGKAGQEWDGVRNFTARNNMRAMQIGDILSDHDALGILPGPLADAVSRIDGRLAVGRLRREVRPPGLAARAGSLRQRHAAIA